MEAKKIGPDMTIGELVQQYPSVAEVLQNEGVHCVGCGAAYYETIAEGLGGHGKTETEIQEIILKLNEAIPQEAGSSEELIVTEKASTKLKELLEKNEKKGLRIKVLKGGCAGFSYDFALENEHSEQDVVVAVDDVKVFVDPESMEHLQGAKVDFIDSLTGAGFKISNPNAQKTCGCGQSFN